MKKTIIAMCMIFVVIASVGFVVASAKNSKQNQDGELKFFEDNPESVSYTKYHGNGIWSTTHILRKGDIEKAAKPVKTTGPSCYKLMGVSWPATPNYIANNDELLAVAELSLGTWDDATNFPLLGKGELDESASWITDGQNSLTSGDYHLTGVIAVCRTTWNSAGEIIEYDVMFDTDFEFGDCDDEDCTSMMDLESIATHEIGHGLGLLDLYNKPCIEQTMFGYSNYGDIEKRTLASGDILGIQALYG